MRKIVNAFCSMSRVNIQLTQKQPEGGRDVLAVPHGPSGNGIVFQRDKSEVFVGGQLSQHRLGKDGIAAVESQMQHQLLHGIRKFDVLRVAARDWDACAEYVHMLLTKAKGE